MPIDELDEDDASGAGEERGRARRFDDFDCPDCSANNPYDEAFGNGDEVRCYYCGQEFKAEVNDSGRLRLRPL
jgi:transcription elongation factor Elf1